MILMIVVILLSISDGGQDQKEERECVWDIRPLMRGAAAYSVFAAQHRLGSFECPEHLMRNSMAHGEFYFGKN